MKWLWQAYTFRFTSCCFPFLFTAPQFLGYDLYSLCSASRMNNIFLMWCNKIFKNGIPSPVCSSSVQNYNTSSLKSKPVYGTV